MAIYPPADSVRPLASCLQSVAELRAQLEQKETFHVHPLAYHREELEQLRQEAFLTGKEEGIQAGIKEGFEKGHQDALELVRQKYQEETQNYVNQLEKSVSVVTNAIEEWYKLAEEKLADLAIIIAERLIHQEIQSSRESVLSIVKEAIKEVTYGTKVQIYVNPFDTELLQDHKEEILTQASGLKEIKIIADESIHAGCVLDSNLGVIDARIENMIRKLASSIIDSK